MNTNEKGNIALAKVVLDLTIKGYDVFVPVSEHGVVDLVAIKDRVTYRFQVKYISNNIIRSYTVRYNSKGAVTCKYNELDFDYYAAYIPDKDVVIYVISDLGGIQIRTEDSQTTAAYYWYEDFLDLNPIVQKRRNDKIADSLLSKRIENADTKIPDFETLKHLVDKYPATEICKLYGVSDRTVGKWIRKYNLPARKRGRNSIK